MSVTYKRGDRVKHATRTDWGIGEILDDESAGKAQIVFEDVGVKKFALTNTPLVRVLGDEAKSRYLDSLVRLHTKKPGKTKGTASSEYISFRAAVEKFREFFPGGFKDAKYLSGPANEREYKLTAHAFIRDRMSQAEMGALIKSGDFSEVCRRTKRAIGMTNLIHHYEALWLSNALSSEGRQMLFAKRLTNLLYGDKPLGERFEDFAKALYDIGAAKWTIATYFPFLAHPDTQIFVKPEVTKHAARMLGIEIGYQPDVTWPVYERIQHLAYSLREKLNAEGDELAPADLIDVQSFIWVIGPGYFV